MTKIEFPPLIDGHVHVCKVGETEAITACLKATNTTQAGVACQYEDLATNTNPAGFVLKARHPDRFYLLAGLEHAGLLYGADAALSPAEQVDLLHALGTDGIKLLASKPTGRKRLGVPVDGPYFEPFFTSCEALSMPLLWHVADPEEFWEPNRLPPWARKQGWGYDASYASKEDLYREIETVLDRHPGLRVVLPHFYFLSARLDRAAAFLESFPGAHFDLAPGIELYYNLSRDVDRSRDFFTRFSDRILFGTDILSEHSITEARYRTGIVFRFLSGDEAFLVPDGADFLLGPPEDGVIRGLNLPDEALHNILQGNFHRIYGASPRSLDVPLARQECLRLAAIEAEITKCPLEQTEGSCGAQKMEGT
ncbi:MAG: amidohydrolase family protein [Candidatus Aminicenantaceae bacterium]